MLKIKSLIHKEPQNLEKLVKLSYYSKKISKKIVKNLAKYIGFAYENISFNIV